MSKRKIILNLAISLDGYIAVEDGVFDWIHGDGDKSHDTKKQFSFSDFMEEVDTIVMGKNAYLDCPEEGIQMYQKQKIYVATNSKLKKRSENVEFIQGDICSQISELSQEEGKDIWIFGGGVMADAFIKANLIDEYVIAIIPTILGKGRRLFFENNPSIDLSLQECTVQEGITIMRYAKKG